MSKGTPFANEKVVETYLEGLLSEPEDPAEAVAATARLLEVATQHLQDSQIDVAHTAQAKRAIGEGDEHAFKSGEQAELTPSEDKSAPEPVVTTRSLQEQLPEQFQALFFEVGGLTLAVPLITLGGIHQLDKISPLIGKPAWFKGVMLHRDEKLSVIDSAMWVMPEKYTQSLAEQLNYQYLIMLSDSAWGLACEKLVNTVTLSKSEVKWREVTGKRPWLAGMVKDRMCALINVQQLILMLNQGLGSQG